MTKIIEIPTSELAPTPEDVLAQQGVPPDAPVRTDIQKICAGALELLDKTASVVGIVSEISLPEFANVFEGEGVFAATANDDLIKDGDLILSSC